MIVLHIRKACYRKGNGDGLGVVFRFVGVAVLSFREKISKGRADCTKWIPQTINGLLPYSANSLQYL